MTEDFSDLRSRAKGRAMSRSSSTTTESSTRGEAGPKHTLLVDFDMLDMLEPAPSPPAEKKAVGPAAADAETGTDGGDEPSSDETLEGGGRPDAAEPASSLPADAITGPSDWSPARMVEVAALRAEHPRLSSALCGTAACTAAIVPRVEPKERVLILFDRGHWRCRMLAQALEVEYNHLCRFVDHSSIAAIWRVGNALAGLPYDSLARKGGISAVLPSGTFLSLCEEDSTILTWELDGMWTLTHPTPEAARELEGACFLRLPRPGAWREPALLKRVARALAEHKFAVLDDLLPDAELSSLREAAQGLYAGGHMKRGAVSTDSVYEVMSQKHAAVTGAEGESRHWTGRGNYMVFCGDADPREPRVGLLSEETDALVAALRRGCGSAEVSARLAPATLREDTMVAAYPGASRARYPKHVDTDRHAVLTALLYLNEGWSEEDGGQLRIYMPGTYCNDVRAEVAPISNRLVLFWSSDEVPHEVLSAKRDRFAMTVWYVDGPKVLARPDAFARLSPGQAQHLNPVAPLSLSEVLRLSGQAESERLRSLCLQHSRASGGRVARAACGSCGHLISRGLWTGKASVCGHCRQLQAEELLAEAVGDGRPQLVLPLPTGPPSRSGRR